MNINNLNVDYQWINCVSSWYKLKNFVANLNEFHYPPMHRLNNNYSLI